MEEGAVTAKKTAADSTDEDQGTKEGGAASRPVFKVRSAVYI